MREILFRGKAVTTGEWVFGDPNHHKNGKVYIRDWRPDADGAYAAIEVNPETIGQYTGMKDCDGRRIFEGDILEYSAGTTQEFQPKDDERTVVRFGAYNCTCCKGVYGWFLAGGLGDIRDFEGCEECGPYRVIGNVHDNPELMGVAK